jgi:alpha-D-xyloside xylohydrolase
VVQYATEKPEAAIEVRIYPGADAKFTLYEDDNETYNYEKGQSARTTLVWNDAARTLAIGARRGAYPGMVKQRTFKLVLADEANGKGLGSGQANRTVTYAGQPMSVTLNKNGSEK